MNIYFEWCIFTLQSKGSLRHCPIQENIMYINVKFLPIKGWFTLDAVQCILICIKNHKVIFTPCALWSVCYALMTPMFFSLCTPDPQTMCYVHLPLGYVCSAHLVPEICALHITGLSLCALCTPDPTVRSA